MRCVTSMQVALIPLPRGPAIGERKAQTQARVQVEEGGFALDTVPSHLRLVRRQREWRVTERCLRIMLLLLGNTVIWAAVRPMGEVRTNQRWGELGTQMKVWEDSELELLEYHLTYQDIGE